ncbi:MAG: membrane protein insertase YidC [Clostridiales bacterium]|nr:membrane protein insertase YidC [Clostridiales bacterium]
MSIGSILYQLFLSPLTLIFEAVYSTAFHILRSSGAAIFPLSLVVNLLLLPFYNRADAIQAEERAREKAMEPFIEHIKKTFKGDERFMMLQTFYRENNYKPIYAVRSSIALVLEVPFFIAAYSFLSKLPDLQGARFLVFSDLSKPDALITIGGFTINVLPVLMTLINVVSSEIYTKGLKFKDKITLHGMALIFLVLLYDSPSGLVLYWTLNNIFSLLKNVVNGSKNKSRTAGILFALAGLGVLVFGFGFYHGPSEFRLAVNGVGVAMLLPLLISTVLQTIRSKRTSSGAVADSVSSDGKGTVPAATEKKPDHRLFFGGALFLTILLGGLIPSAVIKSSVSEFVLTSNVHSPNRYVFFAFLTAAGFFLVWWGLFYYLASNKAKRIFTIATWICAITGTANYMIFGANSNSLTPDLRFDVALDLALKREILDLLVIIVLTALIIVLFKKKESIIKFVSPVLLIAIGAMTAFNCYSIQTAMPNIRRVIAESGTERPTLTFSKDGQNVIVLMIDRAVAAYVPYLFQENPTLAQQFQGFTWYPNTLSFGTRTLVGAPALFGGYDYMPSNTNKRTDMSLVDKHNEALLTMPVIFSEAGYDVTVMDPPYAGYSLIPDLSIYEKYEGIKAYNTEFGQFREASDIADNMQSNWKRNFFCYSLMKVAPLFTQSAVYSTGIYFQPGTSSTALIQGGNIDKYTVPDALLDTFLNSYEVLRALPSITTAENTGSNTFLMMQNSATHNIIPLQEPSYEPQKEIDNGEYDRAHADRFTYDGVTLHMDTTYQMAHYESDMAALIQLGNWMDYLRELGVYDNTRIIIVADHAWGLGSLDSMLFGDGDPDTLYNAEDAMGYNPFLFYKDFNSNEEFHADYTFMTNADTPTLAMEGLFDDPVNPFTGNPIFQPDAKDQPMYVLYTDNWSAESNSGNTFTNSIWFTVVNQNVLDKNNWKKEEGEP